MQEIINVLKKIEQYNYRLVVSLDKGQNTVEEVKTELVTFSEIIGGVKNILPNELHKKYKSHFNELENFCLLCQDDDFLIKNVDILAELLILFDSCIKELQKDFYCLKKCVCCNSKVIYRPLSPYYNEMKKRYGCKRETKNELLNKEEYLCPVCGSSDRDRMIVSFLKKSSINNKKGIRLLQFAPARAIEYWIQQNCLGIKYESTDLYMEGVSYQSDIQNMNMIEDESYDLIICSHVLEHVEDDRKALKEMKRILKSNGKIVFLVPVDLNSSEIDEEWGLTEAENWQRFGQGDHCRLYSKKGLIERLEEYFYVSCLGKEFFGEEKFKEAGLLETSILYILSK